MIKTMLLLTFFSLLLLAPAYSDYGYWNYYGSGRDHPYSAYVDRYHYVGYADYAPIEPDYVDFMPLPAQQILPTLPGPSAIALQNEFTVNIPNKLGGYTSVVIRRKGDGFIGPQGEYYPEFPKVFQLEIMYGK